MTLFGWDVIERVWYQLREIDGDEVCKLITATRTRSLRKSLELKPRIGAD